MDPLRLPPNEVSSAAFEAQKAAYLQNAKLRNLGDLTIRQMEQALRVFIVYAAAQGVREAGQVDGSLFERYKAHLMGFRTRRGEPLSVGTVRDRLFIVQRWFLFLRKRGLIAYDPVAEVAAPRPAKRLPRGILRPDEVERLMATPNLKSLIGYRDRTMMELLYASGARAAEVSAIKVGDVSFEAKTVRVLGKGGKQRLVPLTTQCCRFLERYIAAVRPELVQGIRPTGNNWLAKAGTAGDRLFVSAYGGPMGPTWLSVVMRRYLLLAGITRPMSPVHCFRHTVATHLLGNGMDVRYVQAILGHNSIDTTRIYAHVERESMRKMLRAHHPLEVARKPVRPFVEEKTNARDR